MCEKKTTSLKSFFVVFVILLCLCISNIDTFGFWGSNKDILKGIKKFTLNYEVKENLEKKGEFHARIRREEALTSVEIQLIKSNSLKYFPYDLEKMNFKMGNEEREGMRQACYLPTLLVSLFLKGSDEQLVDFKYHPSRSSYKIRVSKIIEREKPLSKIPVQCQSSHYILVRRADDPNQKVMEIYLFSKDSRIPVYVKDPNRKWELCLANIYEHKKVVISDEDLLALAKEYDVLKKKRGVIQDIKIVTKESSNYPLLQYTKRCSIEDDLKKKVAMEIIKSRLSSIDQGRTPSNKIIQDTYEGYYIEVTDSDIIHAIERKVKHKKGTDIGLYDLKKNTSAIIYYCQIHLTGKKLAEKKLSFKDDKLYKWVKESKLNDLCKE